MRTLAIFALTALLACSCRGRSADLPDASPLTPTANATTDAAVDAGAPPLAPPASSWPYTHIPPPPPDYGPAVAVQGRSLAAHRKTPSVMPLPHRFIVAEALPSTGPKAFSRADFVAPPEGFDPLVLLGKLTALFGRPTGSVDGGFSYAISDTSAGLQFTAYSGPSGPSYAADHTVDRERLRASVRAFEDLLATVRPVDCEIEVTEEVDYGGARVRTGLRDGRPFREEIGAPAKKTRARSVKSYEDCVAAAKARGGAYGLESGWAMCLDKVLPEVPDSFEIGARTYENCIGFVFCGPQKVPGYAFDEFGHEGMEEIEVTAIPWPTPLSKTAQLWLTSYAQWRESSRRTRKAKAR
jgi:hypothetical protein